MIKVDGGKIRVQGTTDIVEMEIGLLLTSVYDIEPESIKAILQFLQEYMDGKINLNKRMVEDDSF